MSSATPWSSGGRMRTEGAVAEIGLDELDQRLLHALQIEPRAAWTSLAPVLGADPSTLARRWRRLHSEGIAWATGFVSRGQHALVEIVCAPDMTDAVIDRLLVDRRVVTLDYTSGGRDLLAFVSTDDLPGLADYGRATLRRLPGVRSTHTHLITEVFAEGSNWRMRALGAADAARVPAAAKPRARAPRQVAPALLEAVEKEVWTDGRVPVKTIAERHGFSPQRVADAIAVLRDNGGLGFRIDVARSFTGWPISAWYFIEAPARTIDLARSALSRVPEIRLAFTSSSRFNLILFVWLHDLADVNRFEIALENALTGIRIADRSVVLQLVKHFGRAVGGDTRVIGTIEPE